MSWAGNFKFRMQAFFVMLPFLCIGFLVSMWGDINRQRASESWPTVEGTVIDHIAKATANKDRKIQHTGRAVYRYVVDGQEYTSHLTDLGPGLKRSTAEEALGDVRGFPKGRSVVVHYDPANPQDGVLVTGIPGFQRTLIDGLIFGAIVGIIGAAISIWSWLKEWRAYSERQRQFQKNREVEELANPNATPSLGMQLGEYRPKPANIVAGWILSVLAIAAGIGASGLAAFMFLNGNGRDWGGVIFFSVAGAALILGGGFLVRYARYLASNRTSVHVGGIRVVAGKRTDDIEWSHIDSIHVAASGQHQGCLVTTKFGKEYGFDRNAIDNIEQMCQFVIQYGEAAGVRFELVD